MSPNGVNERGRQVGRMILMIQRLHGSRWHSYQELGRHFHVSTKTVRRDIVVIERIGLPVQQAEHPEDHKTVLMRIDPDWRGL